MGTPEPPRLMDKHELAARLGFSVSWVEKQVAADKIPCTRIGGGRVRFTEDHFWQIVRAGENKPKE